MKYVKIVIIICVITFIFNNKIAYSKTPNIFRNYGDFTAIILPLTSLGTTIIIGDEQGSLDFLQSFGVSMIAYSILNPIVAEKRPDGSNNSSFPSGHAMSAFTSSQFLWNRYGWEIGVIPTILSMGVAYSRVQAKKHYIHDVLASFVISEISSWIFVSKYNNINFSYNPLDKSVKISYILTLR